MAIINCPLGNLKRHLISGFAIASLWESKRRPRQKLELSK